jgi:hypothetical protein
VGDELLFDSDIANFAGNVNYVIMYDYDDR